MKIFKYQLDTSIKIPYNAKILSIQRQNGILCAWALVDPSEPPVTRRFRIIGTGFEFDPKGLEFLATVQGGSFVWHIFEEIV